MDGCAKGRAGDMKRKCEACPAEVMAVCRHAFGKFWGDKSTNGEGCDFPLDDVADAWRKAGWTPDAQKDANTAPARFASGGHVIEVAAYADDRWPCVRVWRDCAEDAAPPEAS